MLNINDFKKNMEILESAFGYDMPDKRVEIYYKTLSPMFTGDRFAVVVNDLMMTCRRFPSIADFMEAKQGTKNLL